MGDSNVRSVHKNYDAKCFKVWILGSLWTDKINYSWPLIFYVDLLAHCEFAASRFHCSLKYKRENDIGSTNIISALYRLYIAETMTSLLLYTCSRVWYWHPMPRVQGQRGPVAQPLEVNWSDEMLSARLSQFHGAHHLYCLTLPLDHNFSDLQECNWSGVGRGWGSAIIVDSKHIIALTITIQILTRPAPSLKLVPLSQGL